MPVANSNRTPPTTMIRLTRSRIWASERTGGQANRRGSTDHSLASTTGSSARPRVMCTPWFTRYSQDGCDGQENR